MNEDKIKVLHGFFSELAKKDAFFKDCFSDGKGTDKIKEVINQAVALQFFKPFQAIHMILGDPEPDVSIPHKTWTAVYNPETNQVELASRNWVNQYRKKAPLHVDSLSDANIINYTLDLLQLSANPHSWGTRVIRVSRVKPLVFQFEQKTFAGSAGLMSGSFEIEFGPSGELKKDDLLWEDPSSWTSSGSMDLKDIT